MRLFVFFAQILFLKSPKLDRCFEKGSIFDDNKPEIHGHSIWSILIGPSFTIFSVDSQIRGLKIIGWIPGLIHSFIDGTDRPQTFPDQIPLL